MLLSMTGYGEAHRHEQHVAVSVELRTVNSRYFKATIRTPEGQTGLEPLIEAVIRSRIQRGHVTVHVRVDREASADDYRINQTVLESYRHQLDELNQQASQQIPIAWDALLALPGVIDERMLHSVDAVEDWPLVEKTLREALEHLDTMRTQEGQAMAADLQANCELVSRHLDHIEQRAPQVAESYRGRLHERLNKLLGELDVRVEPADIVKEVGLFAERCDISEEIVRLRSHLVQFAEIIDLPERTGRKLDFITQEMFRETNTIGSKANDSEIAKDVVEIKAAIERLREMIQNVE